jgi:hypothetical protein
MKRLTKVLKITAIVLNTIFLVSILIIFSRTGAHLQTLRDWAEFILIFAFPLVTLITMALICLKKFKILTSVFKIIAIVVNAYFLVFLIYAMAVERVYLEGLAVCLVYLMYSGLPVVNVLAVVLTFRKGKATSDEI